jgi:hypothetical protein
VKPKSHASQCETEREQTFFLGAPEISVFVACCVMINELRGLRRSQQLGDVTETAFRQKTKSILERLSDAAEATHRFDIVFPVMAGGNFSPFFWRWFNWWDDYLKALTPSQVAEAERRAHEGRSLLDDLRPKGHWIAYRSTPPIHLPA